MSTLLNTKALKRHSVSLYKKAIPAMIKDGVYTPLTVIFRENTNFDIEDQFCFTDENGYHLRYIERGQIGEDRVTHSLLQITYWTIETGISEAAAEFELKHRVPNQDCRRISFAKELQYFQSIGPEYADLAKLEIDKYLNIAPFEDV